jgi:hypothetical protein
VKSADEEDITKKNKSKKGKNKKDSESSDKGEGESLADSDKKACKRAKDMEMLRNMGPRGVLDNIFVILFLGLLLMALFVGISYVIPTNVAEIKMTVMLVGIIFVAITWIQILVRRANLYTLLEEMEIEQNFEEAQTETPTLKEDAKQAMADRVAELKAKEYTIENYRYCKGTRDSFTKYVTDTHGTIDGRTRLEASDDAAVANWGGGWRMPTKDEISELYNECRHCFVTYKGMDGYMFTGKNGRSIFIPAAGIWVPGKGLCEIGHNGSYYTSDLDDIESVGASGVYFYSAAWGETGHYREYGRSVRAVKDR